MLSHQEEIKKFILSEAKKDGVIDIGLITTTNLEELWDELADDDNIYDYLNDFRCSGDKTNLRAAFSRHYGCDFVAKELCPGCAVGWNYWYGGGKHGEPEAIEWLDSARFLNVKTEMREVKIYSEKE